MDPNFGIEVAYFSNEAIFEQRIRLKKPAATVKGVLEFMVCDDQRCLPPTEVEFSIKAENADCGAAALPKKSDSGEKVTEDPDTGAVDPDAGVDGDVADPNTGATATGSSDTSGMATIVSDSVSNTTMSPAMEQDSDRKSVV